MRRYTIEETAVYAKYVRWCGRTGPRGPSYPIVPKVLRYVTHPLADYNPSVSEGALRRLEVKPQRKLQVSRKTRLAGDFSELAGGRSQLRAAQVWMINEIISLGAELDSRPVVDGESLDQGEIPIL